MAIFDFIRNSKSVPTKWSSEYYFKIAIYCWTIGLNTALSSPVMIQKEFGGFLYYIPCVVVLILYSIPIGYLELALGQFCVESTIGIWRLCRAWRGTGFASLFVSALSMIYHQCAASVFLYYVATSWDKKIKWTECPNEWIKEGCFTFSTNWTIRNECNLQHGEEYCSKLDWGNSAEYFFKKIIHHRIDGNVTIQLLFISAVTIFILFLCLSRGTGSIENIIGFLFYTPMALQLLLLFVSLIHPGCTRSFVYIFTGGNWRKLIEWETWEAAIMETSNSIRVGYGVFFLLGATSPSFRSPVHITTIMACAMCISYSFIFSITTLNALGTLSYELNIPLDDIVQWPLSSWIFANIPLSIVRWGGISQIWCVAYFFSLYILAVRNVLFFIFLFTHAFVTSFPSVTSYFTATAGVVCISLFSATWISLQPQCFTIMEYVYVVATSSNQVMVLCLECVGIMWIYGVNHFMDDIYFMLGFRASVYWQISWAVGPIVFLIVFYGTFSIWTDIIRSREDILFPVSILIAFLPAIIVFLYALIYWLWHKRDKNFKTFAPAPNWGPVDPVLRKSRKMFSTHSVTKEYIYRQERLNSSKFTTAIPVVISPTIEENQ